MAGAPRRHRPSCYPAQLLPGPAASQTSCRPDQPPPGPAGWRPAPALPARRRAPTCRMRTRPY